MEGDFVPPPWTTLGLLGTELSNYLMKKLKGCEKGKWYAENQNGKGRGEERKSERSYKRVAERATRHLWMNGAGGCTMQAAAAGVLESWVQGGMSRPGQGLSRDWGGSSQEPWALELPR